jgi:carboxylesterase type B
MSPGDVRVSRALQAAVLRFVATGTPGWAPYARASRCTALFEDGPGVVTVVRDPARPRRLAWERLRRRVDGRAGGWPD